MSENRVCPNCETNTAEDICPACDVILVGDNAGKERWEVPSKKPKKK